VQKVTVNTEAVRYDGKTGNTEGKPPQRNLARGYGSFLKKGI
jgi:hypothetical protein